MKPRHFLQRKNLPIWNPNLPTKNTRSPYLRSRKDHMYAFRPFRKSQLIRQSVWIKCGKHMWYTQILNDVWRANPKDVWKSTVLKETQQSPGGCLFDGLHCMMNFQRNRQDGYLMIIIFHTSPQKHVLWVLIRIASPSDSNEYLGEAILMSTHNTF